MWTTGRVHPEVISSSCIWNIYRTYRKQGNRNQNMADEQGTNLRRVNGKFGVVPSQAVSLTLLVKTRSRGFMLRKTRDKVYGEVHGI